MIATLTAIGRQMQRATDPWWIIGSAAVTLHGGMTDVSDIDLLTSERDAFALIDRLTISRHPTDDNALFRSRVFAQWRHDAWIVDIMGGLTVCNGQGWSDVVPVTRLPIRLKDATVFIPERHELIDILRRFGREKDETRAQLLSAP